MTHGPMTYDKPLLTVLGRCRAARPSLVVAVLGGLAENGFGIAAAATAGWLVGAAASGAPVADLTGPAVAAVVCVLLAAVGNWVLGHQGHAFAFRAQAELRTQLYDGLALDDGESRRGGDVASVVMGDVDALEGFFAHLGIAATAAGLAGVGGLVALAGVHPALAGVVAVGMVALTVLPLLVARVGRRRAEALRAELGVVNADVVDGVQGLRELLVLGRTGTWYRRIAEGTRRLRGRRMAHARAEGAQEAVTDVVLAVTAAAVLIVVFGLVRGGRLELPAGIMAVALAVAAMVPVSVAVGMAGALAPLRASATRVLGILDAPAPVPDTGTADVPEEAGRPEIRFEGVGFGYPGRGAALTDVDLVIPSGGTVALVGASGAGKSTCVRLLSRWRDPDSGRITLAGRDLRELPLDALPRLVAVVAQDVHLFAGTVAENLRLARPGATDAELEAAARTARAHGFIQALPQGYDTPLGERGATLSGGQRQRLSIARALLADTPVLVLDEAASSLDAENERQLQAALAEAGRGRTTLVVAHRLSTVRHADRIVLLDQGRVVESGRHDELLASGGRYATLMAHQ